MRQSTDDRIRLAKQFFAEGFSPEEWVARRSHEIASWSLDEITYDDPILENWIAQVTELMGLNGPPRSEIRSKYLTPEEIKEIEDSESNI